MRETSTSEIGVYLALMEDIKRRLWILDNFLAAGPAGTDEVHDYEFTCLHLRKILETIAFATLVANKDPYSRNHPKFAKHWKAKGILDEISKFNDNFYPVPYEMSEDAVTKVKNLRPLEEGFLTKDEFVALYDRCSFLMHAISPFHEGPRAMHFGYPVTTWIHKIKWLLGNHFIRMVHSDDIWIIAMQSPDDGQAHGYLSRSVVAVPS